MLLHPTDVGYELVNQALQITAMQPETAKHIRRHRHRGTEVVSMKQSLNLSFPVR
jgi:hypothetical protein